MNTPCPAALSSLLGEWEEIAPSSTGHTRSLATFTWQAHLSRLELNGTNYWDDGRIHCHFQTEASWLNEQESAFYYIFSGRLEATAEAYTGFGVIHLNRAESGAYTPLQGHFTTTSTAPVAISHTLCRLKAES